MPGRNTDTEFHKDDENYGIGSGEMNSTVSDDPASPAKVVSAPENPIARLEDEMQNFNPPHMKIQNKHGNSVAPKVVFEGDEERELHFAKDNDINHQELTSFQQREGEEDNAMLMSNLDDLDNGLTEQDYASEPIDQNSVNRTLDTKTAIVNDVCYGFLNKVCSFETKSAGNDCTPRISREASSTRESIHDLAGEVVSSKVIFHKPASINDGVGRKRDLTVDNELVSRGIELTDVPDNSSKSSVECQYGNKLHVDKKNNTPASLNTKNYRLLPSECNSDVVDVQRNVMKSVSISEETSNLAGKKMQLSKFFDSHVLQTEKAISEIQHVDSGDPHLGTSRLGCLATYSPENIPKKNGASRELRRASLMLIPPHGANRFSSSFTSCESSRVRSVLFPTGANRFLSVSSAGGSSKPQTCKEQQVDCSNHLGESCMPMLEQSSKAGEGSHLQTGVLENKQYHEETQSGLKNTMVGDAHIEVKSKKGPPTNNFGQQDADMLDSMQFGAYHMKNPKHELDEPQVFQNETVVQHVDEKGIQRDFKSQAEIKTHFSNALVESEAKGKRVHSRFKNDYKKFTFFRKFRNMNNLARISSMREEVLARRRSSCVVSASVDHICSNQKGGCESRGTAMVDHTEGNNKSNKSKMEFSVFGKKRFLEKALFESAKRLQAQKMLRSGVYDGSAMPKKETEPKKNSADNSSEDVNQRPLNIAKCESELDSERIIEQKKGRREQFKKSLMGKSRGKTKEIAKRVAAFQRSQILQSKRGHTSTVSAITNIQETKDGIL